MQHSNPWGARLMKYFSNNPRITDTDAKIIGEFIHKRFKGQVTAKELLAEARSPKCPVHKYFEWDDTKAAELYRLRQAIGNERLEMLPWVC
jgi:hypothetical protein